MAFLKRLGYFVFGLSLGIVCLTFFFKKKSDETGTSLSFCYLPNCRTLKDIRSKPLHYSEEISTLLLNKELDSTDIAFFLINGDVDFGNSDTKSNPCKTYLIEGELHGKEAILTVKNCKDKAQISKLVY
ncbi:DUF4258 domain-containing protein [uncultured Maribacter sp.]|uniref:DUF4258 domain-containing protein n=1 Tax=uncultured Maribacter sp. TaxID=431308 RepID=UPI002614C462|nr:DUF4258 domain-containing protein [uncultured Maribacter sp.]